MIRASTIQSSRSSECRGSTRCATANGAACACRPKWNGSAARGGLEGRLYPWGDELPPDATQPLDRPRRVASRAPNGYRLYDMCENVHEWCSDWFNATRRASRGGSWRHQITVSRCDARSSLPPDFRYNDYGFRVARSLQAT